MSQATAFLSYTRTDDDFHGGYITSFRKTLENAVHVVTGEKTFHVFQDVEGIVVGENWRKKLEEVIHDSSFFIPMLTPLFFNSKPCREELTQFLQHEQSTGRGDLILPIYFFTCPKLEKDEEKAKDPLASELAQRQMFDWRERADIPLDQPAARKSVVELASQIAERLEGLEEARAVPKRTRGAAARYEAVADEPALATGVVGNLKREPLQPRTVLWVDDSPDNNIWERRALESYGMRFVLARNTGEAERLLQEKGPFAAIISDMGRPGDGQAGLTLLGRVRQGSHATPYFIYTTAGLAATLSPIVSLRGGQGITGDPDALVQMLVAAVRQDGATI